MIFPSPNSKGQVQAFTAAQIAAALGKHPQVIRRWLNGVAPDGRRVVRGKSTAVWRIDSLPVFVQERLQQITQQRGFRSIDDLLGKPDAWQPEIPWNEVCSEQQEQALKLQRALMPVIERRKNSLLDDAELQAIGARQYQVEFGRAIKAEKWRYLFDRTLERDRGFEQFHRPELFLPGNLKRSVPAARSTGDDADFEPLNFCIGNFGDPQNPNTTEIDALWIEAVELFSELAAAEKPTKAKRRLLGFLWRRAPFLAKSKNALRVNLDRKTKAWRETKGDETALLDGRQLKRGARRAESIPQPDIDRLVWHSAHNCGGRTAQAVRELGQLGERSGLSAQTLDLINTPHSNKTHVNRRLFSTVHGDVKLIAPHLLGKKAKDDATPSLRRDYSRLRSMHVLTADDFTMPVYMFVPDGKGWWILTRGQCLLMIDVRSLKIIAFSLQPERNYNSLVIRTLMNRTCRQWGLPLVWYLENGIWRCAKMVKGAPREWSEGKSWGEIKPGWSQLGVKFIHAKKARSKPAELVGGLLQNLMERVPGYCGRDERRDCPEDTRRNKLAVEARRVEPHGLFLSFNAWQDELGKLVESYNRTVQQGRILAGMSPDRAFESYWPHDDPPTKFDASCWHLLAHYVSERVVGVDGVSFKIGGTSCIYRDENSSALRGQKVLAWLDPECPELLGVTDLNGRNPQLIQRAGAVDFLASLDHDGEDGRTAYQTEMAKAAGHNSYPRARYHVLKAAFEPTFRKNFVAPATAHVAETFQAGREQIQQTEQTRTIRVNTAARRARKLGLPAALVRPGDDLAAEGLEMMARAARSHDAAPSRNVAPKETYQLKPFGNGQREYVDYLIKQLTKFRSAGKSFGQNFSSNISSSVTARIARSQLLCDLYAPEHFREVCGYLKSKKDATILGKRNFAKGVPNYHEFEMEQLNAGPKNGGSL
jgi:hypothetical protein